MRTQLIHDNSSHGRNNHPSAAPREQMQALITRFGSRRALIEELDRRKRLSLLTKPHGGEHKEPGIRRPKIANAPNPQWRELDTPSLLISGEKLNDFTPAVSPSLALALLDPMPLPRKRSGSCVSCGISYDEQTEGCAACDKRHFMRAHSKAKRDGIIK